MVRENDADLENQPVPGHTDTQTPHGPPAAVIVAPYPQDLPLSRPLLKLQTQPQDEGVTLGARSSTGHPQSMGGLTPCLDTGGPTAQVTMWRKVAQRPEMVALRTLQSWSPLSRGLPFWNVSVAVKSLLQMEGRMFPMQRFLTDPFLPKPTNDGMKLVRPQSSPSEIF